MTEWPRRRVKTILTKLIKMTKQNFPRDYIQSQKLFSILQPSWRGCSYLLCRCLKIWLILVSLVVVDQRSQVHPSVPNADFFQSVINNMKVSCFERKWGTAKYSPSKSIPLAALCRCLLGTDWAVIEVMGRQAIGFCACQTHMLKYFTGRKRSYSCKTGEDLINIGYCKTGGDLISIGWSV